MIKELRFNYGLNEYAYYPESGCLYRRDEHVNCISDLKIVEFILELPYNTQKRLIYLFEIDKDCAIMLLKDILIIYNKGKEIGSNEKKKEIRKALGIEE